MNYSIENNSINGKRKICYLDLALALLKELVLNKKEAAYVW